MIPLLFIFSLVPIWRRAGVDKPLNTWQYLGQALKEPMPHISVEEALDRAEEAGYFERSGNIATTW